MRYYLGIDGGGSKTVAMIVNDHGDVVGLAVGDPTNIHNRSLKQTGRTLLSLLTAVHREAAEKTGLNTIPLTTACIGLASLDQPADFEAFHRFLGEFGELKDLLGRRAIIVNDSYIGFRAGSDQAWGIAVLAGTGSQCYGVDAVGKVYTAGDWDYLLGDQHSGFALGQKIAQEVMREVDGRKTPTLLSRVVRDYLKLKSPADLPIWFHRQAYPVQALASLAALCEAPELQDHPMIDRFLHESIQALVDSYRAVLDVMIVDSQVMPVILIGGLFSMELVFTQPVIQALKTISPSGKIIKASRDPIWGAIAIARSWQPGTFLPQLSLSVELKQS